MTEATGCGGSRGSSGEAGEEGYDGENDNEVDDGREELDDDEWAVAEMDDEEWMDDSVRALSI